MKSLSLTITWLDISTETSVEYLENLNINI